MPEPDDLLRGGDIARIAADAADLPDYADVVRRGHRRRARRRAGVVGGAAVAIVAMVGVVQLAAPSTQDGPIEPAGPTPSQTGGQELELPYLDGEVLHVGSVEIETDLGSVHHAAGTVVVGSSHFRRGSQWFLVDGDKLAPVVASDHLVHPSISPDGSLVAWVEEVSEDLHRVVAWDVASREEVGRTEFSVRTASGGGGGGEMVIRGIDLGGRLYLSSDLPDRSWSWRPGEDPVEIGGTEGLDFAPVRSSWPRGLMVGRGSAPGPGQYGTVDDAGQFERRGTVPDNTGLWSPDGSLYAWGGPGVGFQDADSGETAQIPVDATLRWAVVGWESGAELIAVASNVHQQELEIRRCNVIALTCAAVPNQLIGPVTFPYPGT